VACNAPRNELCRLPRFAIGEVDAVAEEGVEADQQKTDCTSTSG
jgi:hypothetical protein